MGGCFLFLSRCRCRLKRILTSRLQVKVELGGWRYNMGEQRFCKYWSLATKTSSFDAKPIGYNHVVLQVNNSGRTTTAQKNKHIQWNSLYNNIGKV